MYLEYLENYLLWVARRDDGGGGALKGGGLCSEVFSDNGGVILMLKSLLHKLLEMFNFTNCFSRKRKG